MQNFKQLRQNIVAIAVKRYGWDLEMLHEIMQDWGFGNSLRALSYEQLCRLKTILLNRDYKISDEKWELDAQGKYMWYLMKQINWNRRRLTILLIKKFHKTHWNLLSQKEKRQVINILKGYSNDS